MVVKEVKRVSKPRYRWWGFVRRMIRDYPGLQYALALLHEQSTVADLSGMPHGSGVGRSIEAIAMRQLPEDDQKVYDAVKKAIEITSLQSEGTVRLKLITMMYWSNKPFTAKAAALGLHISDATAKRWHGDFVRLVGKCYGFKS
jgi:hypothetical protein